VSPTLSNHPGSHLLSYDKPPFTFASKSSIHSDSLIPALWQDDSFQHCSCPFLPHRDNVHPFQGDCLLVALRIPRLCEIRAWPIGHARATSSPLGSSETFRVGGLGFRSKGPPEGGLKIHPLPLLTSEERSAREHTLEWSRHPCSLHPAES
jgi:hypothetical protein